METNFFHLHTETPPLEDGPDPDPLIDSLNNETFGSGAIEADWENDHAQFAAEDYDKDYADTHSFLNEDELEISNQQLAAAVEELVLKSDQDQDAIDPAIVSLRKESRPSSYQANFNNGVLSPYLESQINSSANETFFLSDGMKSIWGESPKEPGLQNGNNFKFLNSQNAKRSPSPIEDAAILTAVKSKPKQTGWNGITPTSDIASLLTTQGRIHTGILRAEDLEKEFSMDADARTPSPTYGISIPTNSNLRKEQSRDRSLPARSVSPVIGSPPAHEMPIGTPPRHLSDMDKQRMMLSQHPNMRFPRGFPTHQPYPIPPRGVIPMGMPLPPQPWPPHPSPHNFHNPRHADLMHRLGLSRNLPRHPNGISPGTSPVGSPRFGSGPLPIRPGFRPPFRQMRPNFSRNSPQPPGFSPEPRFLHPPPIHGPGHLHPEHRRFVFMQQQQRNKRQYHMRNNNRSNYRNHNRDPYSDLMTQREKDWVVKIQMMALQSDRPEIDDYYYQNYIEKQLQQGGLMLDGETGKKRLLTPTKANPDHKKYIPVQFKDSLGKLTVSSVYSPRQVIDVVHKSNDDETADCDSKQPLGKRFEVYKTLEKAYDCVMAIEENASALQKPNISPERKLKMSNEIDDKKSTLIEALKFETEECGDLLLHIFRIRKGKRLLSRVLAIVSKEHVLILILTLFKNLPLILKRDVRDEVMPEMYFPLCAVLDSFNEDVLLKVAACFTSNLTAVNHYHFGFSLICKFICLAHTRMQITKEQKSWKNYLLSSTSALLDLFSETKNKTLNVHLIDNNLANDLVAALEWAKENDILQDSNDKENSEGRFENAVHFFTALSQDKVTSATEHTDLE